MQVVDLLYNDVLSQFYKGYFVSEEEKRKRKEKVSKCNHLFVCTDIDDISPVIECIHCSLSNRTLNFYYQFSRRIDMNKYKISDTKEKFPFEAKLFIENYPSCLIDNNYNFDLNNYNLISKEVIKTWHARILYLASSEIEQTDDYLKSFQIMKELNELEDDFERIKIENELDIFTLVRKYIDKNNPNKKVYKK